MLTFVSMYSYFSHLSTFLNIFLLNLEHELNAREKNIEFINKNYPKLKMESIRIQDLVKKYLRK